MKRIVTTFIFVFLVGSTLTYAQYREDVPNRSDYSGGLYNPDPSKGSNLANLFNVKLNHSYSVNFASFGGQAQNINAFTSSAQFFFSPKLTGRLDVSFLHSPFGGGNSFSQNGIGNQIIIQNAELNYRVNDRTSIHFSFNQAPRGFFGSPFGSPFGFSRFDRFSRLNRANRFGGGFYY